MSVKLKHTISLLQENFYTIGVVLSGGNSYTYKVPKELQLEKEDLIVIDVKGTTKLAYVDEIHDEPQIDFDSNIDYKWIIQKVDFTEYNKILEAEKEALKKIKAAKRAKEKQEIIEGLGLAAEAGLIEEVRGLVNFKDETHGDN